MLDIINIPTVWILSAFCMIFCTSVMFFLWLGNKAIQGVHEWFLAMLSFTTCLILLSIFNLANLGESVFLALLIKECTLIGYIFVFVGTRKFFSFERHNQALFYGLLIFFSVFLIEFAYGNVNEAYALILMSMASILVFSGSMITVIRGYLRQPPDEHCITGSIFLSIVLLATVPKDVYEIIVALTAPLESRFEPVTVNLVSSFFALYFPMLLVLGFAILCNERKENKLKQLHLEAEEHVALRSRFLAIMGHEIRTPLNGIMGIAQLMQSKYYNSEIQSDCQTIVNAADLLNDIANNVLEYAKLDSHDIPLAEEDVSLQQWLDELFLLFQPLTQSKNLTLTFNLTDELQDYYCFDQKKLKQVLINLIGNSVKFTKSGGVEVRVSKHFDKKPKTSKNEELTITETLHFCVEDTGIGIPEGEQPHLLQPFSRATNVANQYSGSGLGLAICDQLLRLMRSKLCFDSQLGKGSRFHFSLEVFVSEAGLVSSQETNSLIQHYQGLSILLVEDLPLNQQIAIAMLAQDKHKVTLAETQKDALRLLMDTTYDLILLDINLPDGSGLSIAEFIKSTPQHQKTPLVAMTARVSMQDMAEYHDSGMAHVVTKPIKQSQLRAVIAQCLTPATEQTQIKEYSVSLDIFDAKVLRQLEQSLGKENFDVIYNKLPSQLELYWQQLLRTLEQTEPTNLAKILHRVSGIAAQLGFCLLSEQLSAWERLPETKNPGEKLDQLEQLKQQSLEALSLYNMTENISETTEPTQGGVSYV